MPSATSTANNTARRGRKPDSELTSAIIEAAGGLLMELGFDRFRIQDVAVRAGAGTGAIYRRWETKEALIADVIRALPEAEVYETTDPVADLRTLLAHKLAMASTVPDLLPGLVAAMRSDPDIAAAILDRYNLDPYRRAIARVIGDDHPSLAMLAEIAPAIALHRNCLATDPLDPEAVADEIVKLVVASVPPQGVES